MARNDLRSPLDDSALTPSKGPQNSLFSWIFGWVMRVLGVSKRHRDVLEDSDSDKVLTFQALALIVSSVAFAVTTLLYSMELVGHPWWLALLVSLAAGAVLFAIDRMTMIDLRVNPSSGRGKAWVVRIASVLMALMMAILSGVKSHGDDIERIQTANASAAASRQLQGPTVVAQVAAANSALKQAEADARRQAELRKALTATQDRIAKAEAELARELGGSFDPDSGKQRAKGRGPKALHWESVRDEARQQTSALQAELLALGDVEARLRRANADIKTLQDQALALGHAGQKGAAKKIEALFQLLKDEWTAWFSLGYGIALALLPEMLLLRAMSRSPSLEAVQANLTPLERRRSRALAQQAARAMKEQIAQRAKRASVGRPSARQAAAHTGSTAFGGPVAAAV